MGGVSLTAIEKTITLLAFARWPNAGMLLHTYYSVYCVEQ
jgi:hypothetical protein